METVIDQPGAQLLPERLAAAGYRSYHSGKWHVDGNPLEQGFAHSLDIQGGQNDFFDPAGITVDGKPAEETDQFYVTTAVGEHAAACLREHAEQHGDKPFFSYVAFTSPHFPLHAPQDIIENISLGIRQDGISCSKLGISGLFRVVSLMRHLRRWKKTSVLHLTFQMHLKNLAQAKSIAHTRGRV